MQCYWYSSDILQRLLAIWFIYKCRRRHHIEIYIRNYSILKYKYYWNLHFLNYIIIFIWSKLKWYWPIWDILYNALLFSCSQRILNYLALQSFDIQRTCTWWMLFQKSVVDTKLDIYICMPHSKINREHAIT